MRIPTYMSYSSFSLYEKDREDFYLKYLSDHRPPRRPQEQPAAVGSAFDAYVKSALHESLIGGDPEYELESLFETQVEPQNRDWAWEEGAYVFDCYKTSGMYDKLLTLLEKAVEPPRFEFKLEGSIFGVPFLGKPDCYAKLPDCEIVHDWKVNGYCSKYPTSPNKGYMLCMDGFHGKHSRSHEKAHKNFKARHVGDVVLDEGYLEDSSTAWADQLTFYARLLTDNPEVVLSIDQVVAKPVPEGRPALRVATFRARVRTSYQSHLFKRLTDCWDVLNSEWIFRGFSPEDSKQRAEMLDRQAEVMQGGDDFFNEAVRYTYRG